MKTEVQTTKDAVYVAPQVECMEVSVETGFQASVGGAGNESYEQEEGFWD